MTDPQPEAPALPGVTREPLVMPPDEFAAVKRSARILANIVVGNHRVMEAARIEMRQNGPHKAMQWILNSLPDVWDDPETEWDGKESADEWFDRTESFYRAAASDAEARAEAAEAVTPAPLTSAQCERLRQMADEWGGALSAVRRALDLTAALDDADREIMAAGRAGLKVLSGEEEAPDGR